jgi:uncharacterized protein YbjT (DUF2867 family)
MERSMRIAVVGGTGLVGRYVVEALAKAGHQPVVISRSSGADAVTGEGLREGLTGSAAVIDVTNTASLNPPEAANFFTTVTRNLLKAESDLGIRHHVLLSIVGVDRVTKNGQRIDLRPTWQCGPFDTYMAGDVLLPSTDAKLTATDLDGWLAA